MSAAKHTPDFPLQPQCEAVLDKRELFAQAHGNFGAAIYDVDGDYVVAVSREISAFDLEAMLVYGERCLELGRRLGKSDLQHALRNLLNAAPMEPTT